jgi:hypothetical protein
MAFRSRVLPRRRLPSRAMLLSPDLVRPRIPATAGRSRKPGPEGGRAQSETGQ